MSLLLVSTVQSKNSSAQESLTQNDNAKKITPIVGRVLADVESLAFGAGLGPKYTTFIFGVEKSGRAAVPVKISYAFFRSQGPPPDSFFDYSKLYALQAVRSAKCDEMVSSLAQVKSTDVSGKSLPPGDALRWMDGAPKGILKPDVVLPCYVLRPGNYKVANRP